MFTQKNWISGLRLRQGSRNEDWCWQPSYSKKGEKNMDFLIFHPFSLLEPKVIIFFNLGLKSIMASHYPLKIDHFGFLQTSKILKNAWEIAFWSFLIFLKLALIFDFSQFQGICTRFKLLWNWIFFILSYFQGWCDTIFLPFL